MAPSERDDTLDEAEDDPAEQPEEPIELVVKKLLQYMTFPENQENKNDIIKLLKEKLNTLGVDNLSHLKHINFETDLNEFIKPVQCRILKTDLEKEEQEASLVQSSSSSSNGASTQHYFSTLHHQVFTKHFIDSKLNSKQRLEKADRLKVVRQIGDALFDHGRTRKEDSNRAGSALTKLFFEALAGKSHGKGDEDICQQIYFHVNYKIREHKKKTGNQRPPTASRTSVAQMRKESYGIDGERDMPSSLPDGETVETQKQKQGELQDIANRPETEYRWKHIRKLMKDTYCSQRASIHERLNMEQILQEWPFIGRYQILKAHFYYLMNVDEDDLTRNIMDLQPKLIKFFRSEAESARPRGQRANIPPKLREIFKKYELHEETPKGEFVTIVSCLVIFMQIDTSQLFVFFEDTTSFDEVQASPKLPAHGKPIIAVLGPDIMDSARCYVILEKRCISTETVNVCHALHAMFMCYFVFKIPYSKELAPPLEFFQRSVYKIVDNQNPKRSKTEKVGKTPPSPVQGKYRFLMRAFEDYCARWGFQPVDV